MFISAYVPGSENLEARNICWEELIDSLENFHPKRRIVVKGVGGEISVYGALGVCET